MSAVVFIDRLEPADSKRDTLIGWRITSATFDRERLITSTK